jgi:KTSC domain
MTTTPARVLLDSTTLAAAIYDHSHHRLCLEFCDGHRYTYSEVTPELFRGLLRATSKGSFFNRYIRGRFPYVKLGPEN